MKFCCADQHVGEKPRASTIEEATYIRSEWQQYQHKMFSLPSGGWGKVHLSAHHTFTQFHTCSSRVSIISTQHCSCNPALADVSFSSRGAWEATARAGPTGGHHVFVRTYDRFLLHVLSGSNQNEKMEKTIGNKYQVHFTDPSH